MTKYFLFVTVVLFAQTLGLEVAELKNQIIETLLEKNNAAQKLEISIRNEILTSRNDYQTAIGIIKEEKLNELSENLSIYVGLIDEITEKATEAGQDVSACLALKENITSIEDSTTKLVRETYYDTGRLIVQYFFKVVSLLRNHDIIFANIEEVLASCDTVQCAEDIEGQMEEADVKLTIELNEINDSTLVTLAGITQGYLLFLDNVVRATKSEVQDIAEKIVECVN